MDRTGLIFKQIQFIFESYSFYHILEKLLEYPIIHSFLRTGKILLVLIFMLSVFYEMYKIVISGSGNYLKVLFSTALIAILLTGYIPFIVNSVNYVDGMARNIISSDLIEQSMNIETKEEEESKSVFESLADKLKFGWSLVDLAPETLLIQLSTMIVLLSIIVIMIIRSIYIAIYTVIGTIALAFFPFEPLQPYAIGWFSSMVQTILIPLIIAVILVIQAVVNEIMVDSFLMTGTHFLLVFNIVFIILILGSMRFLQKLKAGTGGFSTFEGLLTVGTLALGKVGIKAGVGKTMGAYTKGNNMVQQNMSDWENKGPRKLTNAELGSFKFKRSGVSTDD